MEAIKLKKGWLDRQMRQVRLEVEQWPDALKVLTYLNSEITQQYTVSPSKVLLDSIQIGASTKAGSTQHG